MAIDRFVPANLLDTRIVVDGMEYASPTHNVDHFKGCVALEIAWNNKDPFYDRDLNNFRLLPRLNGGSGGGCPIVVFGIKKAAYVDDRPVPPAGNGVAHV